MQQSVLAKIKLFLIRNRNNRIFRKFVHVLCCLVVFVTTYALILPAITMEQDSYCGLEEHIHSEECFAPTIQKHLTCTLNSLNLHEHSNACYNAEQKLICGLADYIIHTHADECYDTDGKIVCTIPQRSAHIHTESCYTPSEGIPHVHSDSCNTLIQGELICGTEAYEGHTHSETCYIPGDVLTCTLLHHTHSNECYTYPLICTLPTDPHVHDDSCYSSGNLLCNIPEAHIHTDSCVESVLNCTTTEEDHICGDACYTRISVCSIPENHSHNSGCYDSVLNCSKEKEQPHEHSTGCYSPDRELICTLVENHVHDSGCYESVLNCKLPVDPGHQHSDDCYNWNPGYLCGFNEGDMEFSEPVLICTEPAAEVHIHSDNCFEELHIAQQPVCGNTDEHHIHSTGCYTISCGLEEHTHALSCYSNPDADVETREIWEATMANVTLTADQYNNVLAIAESQLGYTESTKNYVVWEDNSIHGYTRYGAWYGVPHGDWCGMFASFCLRYAGIEDIPINYGVRPWIEDLTSLGLYHSAEEALPKPGCLIFFDWEGDGLSDHVGIVAKVTEASEHMGAEIKTIEGNSNNCVRYVHYTPDSPEILGYAFLPGDDNWVRVEKEEEIPEYDINMDITKGPVVIVTSREISPEIQETKDPQMVKRMMFAAAPIDMDSTGDSNVMPIDESTYSIEDLKEYLSKNPEERYFFFTLTDRENNSLTQRPNGSYIVNPDTVYKLSMSISSKDGFTPNTTYTYQLPEGLQVVGGTGPLVVKGEKIGSYVVSDDGLISFSFDAIANEHTEIIISATMGASFSHTDTEIDFDGKIHVTIETPPEEEEGTRLEKWGSQGKEAQGQDSGKLYWTIKIIGQEGSTIPGSIIRDHVVDGGHKYIQSDMENGITFGVSEKDSEGNIIDWHTWTLHPGDDNLIWTEQGWEYTIPHTVICDGCDDTLTLGSHGWEYLIHYTSTPDASENNGIISYQNRVTVDNISQSGWADFIHGTSNAGIIKEGAFRGDKTGGKFYWEIRALIPGMKSGQTPDYNWYFLDEMVIPDGYKVLDYVHNDLDKATVTVTRNGQTISVPSLADATENDDIAWNVSWSQSAYGDSDVYHRQIVLYTRCTCKEDSCRYWGGYCTTKDWNHNNKFCLCWTIPEDVVITFKYTTDNPDIIDAYGGKGYSLRNTVQLYKIVDYVDNEPVYIQQGNDRVDVNIPSLLSKELTNAYDGHFAKYQITLNEGKLNISPDGTPITIIDKMTDSLAYISGSMVITAEDTLGSIRTLSADEYTLQYNGADQVDPDTGKKVHILTIVIKNPEPVMYTMNYDTTLVIPDDIDGSIKYSNSATVTIWNQQFSADSVQKEHGDINISSSKYQISIVKTQTGTDIRLPGAVFGLFNKDGGLIKKETTNENGELRFVTDILNGLILVEHEPYYIQELEAPDGYMRDDTKHWFFFCNAGEGCTDDNGITDRYSNISRIPADEITYNIENTFGVYELPETGGTGTKPYTTGGMLLILAAALLMYNQKSAENKISCLLKALSHLILKNRKELKTMNAMRKIASLLLALVMIFSLTTTAFAASNSITVNGTVIGETYKLYKMLNLSVDNEAKPSAFSYSVATEWETFFKNGNGKDYVEISTSGYVSWKQNMDSEDQMILFGQAAAAYAATLSEPSSDHIITASSEQVVFNNLEPGYYLVTSTLGTKAIVNTTPSNMNPTINEKNPQNTIDKKVQEENTWGTENDAQIGETVNFKSEATVNPYTRNVKIHDTMTSGLTFTAGSIKIYTDANCTTELGSDHYTVQTPPDSGDTFTIKIEDSYIATLTAAQKLYVTYSATLNENAVVKGDDNAVSIVNQTNKTTITYGNNQSVESTTSTTTHKFSIFKHATDSTENLAGAVFQLKKGNTVVNLIKLDDNNYRVAKTGETGAVTTFTTVKTDDIVIWGVDSDADYSLEEITPPTGYNKLTEKIDVTVNADNSTRIDVENNSGTQLPSTGGIGTTVFYVLGGIMVLAAVILLITKKRMSASN